MDVTINKIGYLIVKMNEKKRRKAHILRKNSL